MAAARAVAAVAAVMAATSSILFLAFFDLVDDFYSVVVS